MTNDFQLIDLMPHDPPGPSVGSFPSSVTPKGVCDSTFVPQFRVERKHAFQSEIGVSADTLCVNGRREAPKNGLKGDRGSRGRPRGNHLSLREVKRSTVLEVNLTLTLDLILESNVFVYARP